MRRRWVAFARAEDGVATLVLPMVLWVALLVAIAIIDAAAYFVAASRAQTAADGAALAAVSADLAGDPPRAAAEQIAKHSNAVLESCTCRRGGTRADVEVSVAVDGLVIPTLGAARVVASAQAVAVQPEIAAR